MKIVHAADLHLDSPLAGLSRYPGAPVEQIRGATRRAFQNLVELCVSEGASLLLLAGDLFDGDWKDFTTGLFFTQQMQALRKANVPVVIARGNHDAASQITRYLKLPDNVHELPTQAPTSVVFEALGVCVHGQSYGRRNETEDLARNYPLALSGYLNIGLLHSSLSGRPGHEMYAPTNLETLRSKGYAYWALGHVHQREIVSMEPWVVFPGNLQGRHLRELGPKGAMLLETSGGVIQQVNHRALDVVRFERCEVSVQEAWTDADQVADAAVSRVAELLAQVEERTLVVRVVVKGRTRLHAQLQREAERWEAEIRSRAYDMSQVWIEGVELATQGATDLERLRQRPDAVGQVLRAVGNYRSDADARRSLRELFADLEVKLPIEITAGNTDTVQEWIDRALIDVERRLLGDLAGDGEGD